MIKLYLLLTCMAFSSVGHATELKLDERMPVSALSMQASSKTELLLNLEKPQRLQVQGDEHSAFQTWWLLLIPAFLFFTYLGWLCAHWVAQRREQQPTFPTEKIVSLNDMEKKVDEVSQRRVEVEHAQVKKPKRERKVLRKRVCNSDEEIGFDVNDLNKAYSYHFFGKSKEMLELMQRAYKYDPFDLNLYIVSMKILSESDKPSESLIRLLRTGLFLLRTKRPMIWKEVTKHGKQFLPDLEDWDWKPE